MSIVVTGGAGFIGSCVVRSLNDAGETDIIVVDDIASTDKWQNLVNKSYREYVHKSEFLGRLDEYRDVEAVIHLGACSSTTERDFDYLWKNNVEYTKALWGWCSDMGASFIYASSAATYGDGSRGFDDRAPIEELRPLNGYGYSKQVFDLWAEKQCVCPPQHVGLKFFNVYGPNEYCKGSMASMVYHGFRQISESGEIRLFKSCNPRYADGGQTRDFVYVKDVCAVIMWLLEHREISGLFNVGTGRAQTFQELAEAVFAALGMEPNIRFIDMPEKLRDRYQYYTQAEMGKLRSVGYDKSFRDLNEAVEDYVNEHLSKGFLVY